MQMQSLQESETSPRAHSVSLFDFSQLKKKLLEENSTGQKSTDRQNANNSGLLQITGTTAFDSFFGNFSTGTKTILMTHNKLNNEMFLYDFAFLAVQNVFTVTLVAFSIALWVSIFVFWLNSSDERREAYHPYYYNDQHYPGKIKIQRGPSVSLFLHDLNDR